MVHEIFDRSASAAAQSRASFPALGFPVVPMPGPRSDGFASAFHLALITTLERFGMMLHIL